MQKFCGIKLFCAVFLGRNKWQSVRLWNGTFLTTLSRHFFGCANMISENSTRQTFALIKQWNVVFCPTDNWSLIWNDRCIYKTIRFALAKPERYEFVGLCRGSGQRNCWGNRGTLIINSCSKKNQFRIFGYIFQKFYVTLSIKWRGFRSLSINHPENHYKRKSPGTGLALYGVFVPSAGWWKVWQPYKDCNANNLHMRGKLKMRKRQTDINIAFSISDAVGKHFWKHVNILGNYVNFRKSQEIMICLPNFKLNWNLF